jgi:hypothetical protein
MRLSTPYPKCGGEFVLNSASEDSCQNRCTARHAQSLANTMLIIAIGVQMCSIEELVAQVIPQ